MYLAQSHHRHQREKKNLQSISRVFTGQPLCANCLLETEALFTTAEVEATQASINRRTDIQNVADAYNGIVVHLKKEEHSDTCCNIKELLRPTLCEIVSVSRLVTSDSLFDSVDSSPPGSSVCGTLQARVLKWVTIPFSKGSSRPRD